MSEPVAKRVVVTFRDGLPLGVHGSFKYGGQSWIAIPVDEHTRILTVTDRLLGALARIRHQLTQWVTAHPQDAERVVMILRTLAAADEIGRAAAAEKAPTT